MRGSVSGFRRDMKNTALLQCPLKIRQSTLELSPSTFGPSARPAWSRGSDLRLQWSPLAFPLSLRCSSERVGREAGEEDTGGPGLRCFRCFGVWGERQHANQRRDIQRCSWQPPGAPRACCGSLRASALGMGDSPDRRQHPRTQVGRCAEGVATPHMLNYRP